MTVLELSSDVAYWSWGSLLVGVQRHVEDSSDDDGMLHGCHLWSGVHLPGGGGGGAIRIIGAGTLVHLRW